MFRSLRVKFVIYFVGFMTASLALLAKSLFDHEHEALTEELRKRQAVEAANLSIQSREAMETNDELGLLATLRARRTSRDFLYAAVLQPDGTVFAHSDVRTLGSKIEIPPGARDLLDGATFYRRLPGEDGPSMEVWTPVYSTLGRAPERIGLVCLALSEAPMLATIRGAGVAAVKIGGLFIVLGIVGTALITRTVTHPIGQLVHGVRRIAAGNLEHKMRLRRGDEIGLLSDSFDHMTDELQRAQHELVKQRLYEKELEVAGKIQAALLPRRAPRLAGCSVAALCVPARVVGGDFYDYLQLGDGRTAFLVADVAGKGVSAGLVMTAVRSAARSVFGYTASPKQALCVLNDQVLHEFDRSTFVTMLALVLDRDGRRLWIANAGHPDVVRVRESRRTAEFVKLRGAAVGVLPAEQFASVLQEVELRLEPGDLVLAYSDGVNETHDRAGSLFGESRLQDFAADHATLGPEEFLKRLHATLEQFSDGFGQFDDITALALKAAAARSAASPPEFAGTDSGSAGTPERVAVAAGAARAGGREDRAGGSGADRSALCETGARS